MTNVISHIQRALIFFIFLPVFISSCATYRQKMNSYYQHVQKAEYSEAESFLNNNSYIQANRNKLLFYLEKGIVLHYQQQYDSSNQFFNLADAFLEERRKSAGDVAAGLLLNPMEQLYTGEPFEALMIHYFKALNYWYLQMPENVRVEARRITLANNLLNDYAGKNERKYSKDAFLTNLEGMLYEYAGDINNAFISYRNAADLYLKQKGTYYDVAIPQQLKHDLLRTAYQMGFNDIAEFYKKEFLILNQTDSLLTANIEKPSKELVLFVETGLAPVKQEQTISIQRDGYGNTDFYFINNFGERVAVPFNQQYYRTIQGASFDAARISLTRIALPEYQIVYTYNNPPTVQANGITIKPALAQNINSLALATLEERFLKEIANAIARQVVKKLMEKGVSLAAEAIANSGNDSSSSKKTEEQKKKDKENAEAVGAVAGLLVGIFNASTEKADTRNWQSLPAHIFYTRIPLKNGNNEIVIENNGKKQKIQIEGKEGMQLKTIRF